MSQPNEEFKNTNYELFIAVLSLFSIVNLVIIIFVSDPDIHGVAVVMDLLMSMIFLLDFGYRILTAESKHTYFIRQAGWADLLGSIPFPQFKALRLLRLWHASRVMQRYGTRRLVREFLRDRAGSALLTVLFLIILVLEFGSMGVLTAERHAANANITNPSDALWWVYVSITTVGYGDQYPVTNVGRLWGVLVVTAGVGLFGVLTGFLANAFLSSPRSLSRGPYTMQEELSEIKQLLLEQRQAQTDMQSRLADLEQSVAGRSSDDTVKE